MAVIDPVKEVPEWRKPLSGKDAVGYVVAAGTLITIAPLKPYVDLVPFIAVIGLFIAIAMRVFRPRLIKTDSRHTYDTTYSALFVVSIASALLWRANAMLPPDKQAAGVAGLIPGVAGLQSHLPESSATAETLLLENMSPQDRYKSITTDYYTPQNHEKAQEAIATSSDPDVQFFGLRQALIGSANSAIPVNQPSNTQSGALADALHGTAVHITAFQGDQMHFTGTFADYPATGSISPPADISISGSIKIADVESPINIYVSLDKSGYFVGTASSGKLSTPVSLPMPRY